MRFQKRHQVGGVFLEHTRSVAAGVAHAGGRRMI
jgi:hypothetical protein